MSESELVADSETNRRETPKAAWKKARLPRLTSFSTAEEALADIVLGCVEHLRGNEQCVLGRSHEEGIHQMRVAVRRLRSCITLYQRFIPEEQRIYLIGELKWLIGELGPARDWDVFSGQIMAPVIAQMADEDRLEALSEHVERHRDEAYARAQAAVGAQRYIGLVLLLNSWAEGRGWRDPAAAERPDTLEVKASEVAHDLLHSIYERLLAAGADFEKLSPEERHKVRIQLKQLRYATEFFSTLFAKRKVTPYLAAMKSLQDQLGVNNDVEVARKLLKRVVKGTRGKVRTGLAYAAGLVVGWHSHVGDGREREVIAAWQQLVQRPPFWEPAASAGTPSSDSDAGGAVALAGGLDRPPPAPLVEGNAADAPEKSGIVTSRPARRSRRIVHRG